MRCVLVIAGKGNEGRGVLRRLVPLWLKTPPLRTGPRNLAGSAGRRWRWRALRDAPPETAAGMTPFGRRMRELRAERGLTQQQQAERLGVSKAYFGA